MRDDRDEAVDGTLPPFRRQRAGTPSPHSDHPISRSAPANLTTGKTTRPSARVAGVVRSRNVGLVFDERQAFSPSKIATVRAVDYDGSAADELAGTHVAPLVSAAAYP